MSRLFMGKSTVAKDGRFFLIFFFKFFFDVGDDPVPHGLDPYGGAEG